MLTIEQKITRTYQTMIYDIVERYNGAGDNMMQADGMLRELQHASAIYMDLCDALQKLKDHGCV